MMQTPGAGSSLPVMLPSDPQWRCRRPGVIVLALAALLPACQRASQEAAAPVVTPAPAAVPSVAQVEGIEWFEGGIDAAFEAARAQDRLVFLYWGAEWCPPCHDLKAHVFPREDFQRALRQFIAVYLDGDAPGAQRIAEQFRVQGYPSVVVLDARRRELARISGGSDLASYAEVLDLALANSLPVEELLSQLAAGRIKELREVECRRLAWNDWSMWGGESGELAGALRTAAGRCPAGSRAERDRLVVLAADLAASGALARLEQGEAADPQLRSLVAEVEALLADADRSREAGNALIYMSEDVLAVARLLAPARVPALQQRYFALLDAVEVDPRQSDTLRLLTAARRVQAARALSGSDAVPPEVEARARATLQAFLARDYDATARSGIVNSASWVLHELGDDEALRALLLEQMQRSRTPYYYMPDLADIEERAGNTRAALEWLERGYRESRGPATRFQWGSMYVDGLLRMAPADHARIRAAVLEVIGELEGPDRIHARTRVRLEKLDAALDRWAAEQGGSEVLAAIGQHWKRICDALPADDPAREGCAGLLRKSSRRVPVPPSSGTGPGLGPWGPSSRSRPLCGTSAAFMTS
jgi:protein disulfide-isomerase